MFFSFLIFNLFVYVLIENIKIIGIFLMYVAVLDFNDVYQQRKLDFLNNLAIILLFVLIVFNIFLVAFYG